MYIIDINNIHIENSYKITKRKEMKKILLTIQSKHPNCKVFSKRSMNSLIFEWVAHNRLYKIGYRRDKTKDVDLDIEETWCRKLIYRILSI